jgi:nicotinate-nucleotide pyrophosphorylase (carboxylating)
MEETVSLNPEMVQDEVRRALDEDVGSGDVTTQATVPDGIVARAVILAKEAGIVAGIPVARAVFGELSQEVQFDSLRQDGQAIGEGDVIVQIYGPAMAILTAERTALNFLQRLSGIATQTSRFVQAVAGTGAKILDTRKTTPGLRFMEKYAVTVGGGYNHRMGLYDMVLIKDNHIVASGGLIQAVQRVRAQNLGFPVEVEVGDLDQMSQAIEAGADRIMLDNMNLDLMREAVALVHGQEGLGRRPELEASGKIHLGNVRQVAMTGVDFISVGALTHSAAAVDMSLVINKLTSRGGHDPA